MAIFRRENITELLQPQEPPCVTMMFPIFRSGADSQQNSVRFKNMLRKASDSLIDTGMTRSHADKFLESAQPLLNNNGFWQNQSASFALFLSGDNYQTFRIPFSLQESLKVDTRFHLSPLLPFFFENDRFYILALSQNLIRLFQVVADNIDQIELIDVPKDIDEMLLQYAEEKQGRRQAYFHGQGDPSLHSEDKIQQYMYLIDKGVHQVIANEHVPLVFAGVDYLYPMWKTVNSYSDLCSEFIGGNPDRLSPKQLLENAKKIVAPIFAQVKQEAIDKYKQFVGTGHTTADPAQISAAASQGRIDILFITAGQKPAATSSTQTKDDTKINDYLIDFAACETFLNRGRLFQLTPEEMPDKSEICATLRY